MEIIISVKVLNQKGAAIAMKNGQRVGECTFSIAPPSTLVIDHTDVTDSERGTGLGEKMIAAIINYSEQHSYKIIPLCPFANAQFKKHSDWNYILKHQLKS
jgi:predicted GNAT family acetyltransferase